MTITTNRLDVLKVFTVYDDITGLYYNVVTDNAKDAIRLVFDHIGPEDRSITLRQQERACARIQEQGLKLGNDYAKMYDLPLAWTDQDYMASLSIDSTRSLKDRMVIELPY